MRSIVLIGLGFVLTFSVVPVHATEPVSTPYELVRTLQRVQDRIALGSVRAHQAQRKLLPHIAKRFFSADPVVWRDPLNARALILFLLAGGDPKVGRRISARGSDQIAERALVEAAQAYAEGQKNVAKKLLRDVEPQTLPASLGGHVALIKSGLYHKSNPKKSLHYLEVARLLMPGTLIEEAALRRGIVAAGNDGDLEKFQLLASQYLRRFGSSVYASDFDSKFSLYLVKLGFLELPERQLRFEQMVFALDPIRLRRLYLSVAYHAVVAGQTANVLFAALRAADMSQPNSDEMERALAYQAMALVVKEPKEAMLKLKQLETKRLTAPDRQLVGVALALTQTLTRRPKMGTSEQSVLGKKTNAEKSAGGKADGVEARAEQLIDTVDVTLQGK